MCDSEKRHEIDEVKWMCEYCTYENFSSSIKCTMCKGQKPLLNEDIFRLSPSEHRSQTNDDYADNELQQELSFDNNLLPSSSVVNSSITSDVTKNNKNKWICLSCSHINPIRLNYCTECHVKRDNDIANAVQDKFKSMSVRDTINPVNDILKNDLKTNSPIDGLMSNNNTGSKYSMEAAARLSPVENKNYVINKWPCTICTFENWPKSLKCSMCGVQRKQSTNNNIIERGGKTKTPSPDRIKCDENYQYQLVGNNSDVTNNSDLLKNDNNRVRKLRKRHIDVQWLNACIGVVDNNIGAVEEYLSCGGNPGRSLTSTEVTILNRTSAYDVGHTLIHLALRFHREEMLPLLLAQISGTTPGLKRVPSYIAPDLASDIRRHFSSSLRLRKGPVKCHYITEHATFTLPAEIEDLPVAVQDQLYDELLDRDAQQQLENSPPTINWSLEVTARLCSRLMVLWNRSAGDCLLDSAMQATWGVFDKDNVLRCALANTLHQCSNLFYSRWKEYERFQAALLHFTLEETQWEEEFSTLLSLASQPGSSLEQLHIFALAHIFRRPIIVYGVKYVKSFRGEDIGFARFEGLYLPLLWEQSFCIKSPIALGYSRGHFSALVPAEPDSRIDAARDTTEDIIFLPLMDCQMKLLPIHFLTQDEMGCEEVIMREWLDVCVTEEGLFIAQQKINKRPLLVAQMLEEWLNHYRRLAQVMTAPFSSHRPQIPGYYSDNDSDDE